MLDKRYYYNKSVALCEEDLQTLRELNKNGDFSKKSLAGTLSIVIRTFNFKKYGIRQPIIKPKKEKSDNGKTKKAGTDNI